MNFCKKCGGKLEDGVCHNCSNENQSQIFCKKCGETLKDGVCSKCSISNQTSTFCKKCGNTLENCTCLVSLSNDNSTDFKTSVKKEPMNPKTKKLIIFSCIGLTLCVGAFVGFKVFNEKRQENFAKEAIALVSDGKFDDAKNTMDKYKKNDTSILELKDLNSLYLDIKKECENGNFTRLSHLNDTISKSSYNYIYITEVDKLNMLFSKNTTLNNLKDIDKLLEKGDIILAENFIADCEKYDLTEEEKTELSKAKAKTDAASDKIKKDEEAKQKYEEAKRKKEKEQNSQKATYLRRYNTLSNDYNDAFYKDMHSLNSILSEAEKAIQLEHIALTWDTLLNDIWKYLKNNMNSNEFESLKKKQIEWVNKKLKVEKEENTWGMSPNQFAINKWTSLGKMNKDRVKFLIDNYL